MATVIYTMERHEKAKIATVTSDSDNKQTLLDGRFNTHVTPSSTATYDIWIDLVEAGNVEAIGLWLANPSLDVSGLTFKFHQSDSLGSGETDTESLTGWPGKATSFGPLYFKDLATTYTKRYIRIEAQGTFDSVPLIAHIFLMTKHDFGVLSSEHVDTQDLPAYQNSEPAEEIIFDQFIEVVDSRAQIQMRRGYHLPLAALITKMELVWNNTGGRRQMFLLQETARTDGALLCRFITDIIDFVPIDYEYDYVVLQFATVQYRREGEGQ